MSKPPRNVSLRHAELSAGIPVMPSGWAFFAVARGIHTWLSPDRTFSVVCSIREYGPVGLWWYVSVAQSSSSPSAGAYPPPPTRKQLEIARRVFCAADLPIERSSSASGIVCFCQRLRRGAWKTHPERAAIEERRAVHNLPDFSFPPDPDTDPACPACCKQDWLRHDGIDESNTAFPLLVCGACDRAYDPGELQQILCPAN